jgi:RNA polymerase sigma-70 factor (ECF subfamily)
MQRDLVIAARDGDLDAYAQLVRAAFPRLYGVANLILRDADRAQDAVQDALVLAWRHVRSLRDPDAWDAWLRRLTVRACYKAASKERRRTELEQHVTLDAGTAVTRDHSAELAERDWVISKLGAIDLDQRAVLVLHYYLDLPVKEVADILDIPYGTAASRLHRGLEALRASMRGPGEAGPELVTRRAP